MTPRTKPTRFIVIHCAATRPSMDIGAREITRWHRERGFLAIGYHYVIRRDGTVEPGRREDLIGAHATQANANSVGICLVGGVDEDGVTPRDNFTDAQWASLERLIRSVQTRYPDTEVIGHRDLPGVAKACPSFDARAWWSTRQG